MSSQVRLHSLLLLFLLQAIRHCCHGSAKDERCIACKDSKCVLCVDGFLKDGRCVEPSYKTEFCLTYDANENCAACKLGYFLTTDYYCAPIDMPHCLELFKYQDCTICQSPMIVRNQKCDPKYTCELKDCDICTVNPENDQLCVLCSDGFVLKYVSESKTVCVPEFKDTSNCLILLTENASKCAVCDFGYYMADGVCIKSTVYSLSLSDTLTKITAFFIFGIFAF